MTRSLRAKIVNAQRPRTIRVPGSNPDTTPIGSDFEHIFHKDTSPSDRTVHASPVSTRYNIPDNVQVLGHAEESEEEQRPSVPALGQKPTPAPPNSICKLYNSAKLRVFMRQMTHKEAKSIHTSRSKSSNVESCRGALSDAFYIGFESANDCKKTAFPHFVERRLMKIAPSGALNKVFDLNVERRTQSSTFADAFARRVLTSTQFVRPEPKIIFKVLTDQNHFIDDDKSTPDSPFLFLKALWLSSLKSGDKPYCTHAKSRKSGIDIIPHAAKEGKKETKKQKELCFI